MRAIPVASAASQPRQLVRMVRHWASHREQTSERFAPRSSTAERTRGAAGMIAARLE
jgi:hypothetical protein